MCRPAGLGLPSISADRTDDSGAVLMLNVQLGLSDVSIVLPDDQREVAHAPLVVRAGTISYLMISPTE